MMCLSTCSSAVLLDENNEYICLETPRCSEYKSGWFRETYTNNSSPCVEQCENNTMWY